MRLIPTRMYKDESDGSVRSGNDWMAFFRTMAQDDLNEMRRGLHGRKPAKGEIPTLREQVAWMVKTYTSGGEWEHNLVETTEAANV